ncbi:MAG: hypothetical protein WAN65_07715 [Candidatus Sulfotelmatobacter sp.]
MNRLSFSRIVRVVCLAFCLSLPFLHFLAHAQDAEKTTSSPAPIADDDHVRERSEWFLRGRVVPRKSAAEQRLRAYKAKMQARALRQPHGATVQANLQSTPTSVTWTPLGPVPLASDATGDGFQDYHQVSGRATAVAIDLADPTGNTVYIGGAQGGVWKSTNAASATANDVIWTPITDDQATLSIGSIAIQPGNSVPANSVILVGTGEADNSVDSYFGLGILRSTNGGGSWTLISAANSGVLSFSGLGATQIAFSTANSNTVVAAMAATSEGVTDGALTSNTYRGLYTSTDAGQTWTYDTLFPGGAAEATSATSVVYNAATGLFFAAIRYHGFYSSPDGLNWTLLTNQPGSAGLLNTTACPQNYSASCPIYRGEISVVPGRNEMYVWFISLDTDNNPVDQGIWQSENGGVSWTQISDSGIINCGDIQGCGVDQGYYNLALLAVPDCPNGAQTCAGNPTDLYAGAINLYKCSINSLNPTCSVSPFMNLTHVYGCSPLSALAHVHPDQHALAYAIPTEGAESGADLMYFANDGGIYRALDGFSGLTAGVCSGTNQFDDLNQNLGSMTQFVTFTQHPLDADMLLGGTQDNGSPVTASATVGTSWGNVLSGDGGYNAIDPATNNWFASNPDVGSGGLAIQECSARTNCTDSQFNVVVSSSNVEGDDGSFYFPYILDPQSATAMLVGTCRVWSGPRLGGSSFTPLSLNFDTLGTGTCAGTEVNVVRALAAGGPAIASGSKVIYATTDGSGPNSITAPIGGNVWVTTNATAASGTVSTFNNVTLNGPGGTSINPNQFPISSVALDSSDATGNTAYVTMMGFTGGTGHVWRTTNAGGAWTDFTGSGGASPLPDSPVNAVVVDSNAQIVYVGTDVGVFQSATSAAAWTEVGPAQNPTATGFLPNVAVTALSLFNSGCQKLLRASTYGRGIWQFSLPVSSTSPDFCLTNSGSFPTVNAGSTITGQSIDLSSVNGFAGTVNLSCSIVSCFGTSGSASCSVSPTSASSFPTRVQVTVNAATLATTGAGSCNLSVGGTSGSTTNTLPLSFNVADFQLSGTQSLTIDPNSQTQASFTITPSTFYIGAVNASCNASAIPGGSCTLSLSNPISVNAGSAVSVNATITTPSSVPPGIYNVTFSAVDPSGNPSQSVTIAVTVPAGATDTFLLASSQAFPSGIDAPSQAIAKVGVTSNYKGSVNATCDASSFGGQCSITTPAPITAGSPATLAVTVNVPNSAAPQPSNSYNVNVTVADASGQPIHTLALPLTVIQDFTIGTVTPGNQTVTAGQSASYNFSVIPIGTAFAGTVTLSPSQSCPPTLSCSFTPSTITPGSNAAAVVLTVTTPTSASLVMPRRRIVFYAMWLALPALVLLGSWRRNKKCLSWLACLSGLLLLGFLLASCGGGGSNGVAGIGGSSGQQGSQSGTYTITVTGTSGNLTHNAASVTLTVQ